MRSVGHGDGSEGEGKQASATEPDDVSLIPGSHVVEEEDQRSQAWTSAHRPGLHALAMVHVHTYTGPKQFNKPTLCECLTL